MKIVKCRLHIKPHTVSRSNRNQLQQLCPGIATLGEKIWKARRKGEAILTITIKWMLRVI